MRSIKSKHAAQATKVASLFSKKKGAMEMSVGTIVTIVLLMAVLVLGLVMVKTIFTSSTSNINEVDKKVKDQINKLFSEDEQKKVIIYPSTYIELDKGKSAGFGLSIRNNEKTEGEFSYTVEAADGEFDCMSTTAANNLISLGKIGENINLLPGTVMDEPVYVRFDIPDDTPPCQIRYNVDVEKDGKQYVNTIKMDVEILSK